MAILKDNSSRSCIQIAIMQNQDYGVLNDLKKNLLRLLLIGLYLIWVVCLSSFFAPKITNRGVPCRY